MIVPAGHWFVSGASTTGASHLRRDAPNQDAIAWLPRVGTAARFVAAVSDGHGAAAHFRSEIGARLAVESAACVLEDALDGEDWELAAAALAPRVLAAWRHAVINHSRSCGGDDGWIDHADEMLLPYGATLIAVAATEHLVVALQIGDGDLFLGFPDGRIVRPLADDEGLHGEQTHSLCEPQAASYFRAAILRPTIGQALPNFAMLSTDGVGKSFADEGAFCQVAEHYYRAMTAPDHPGALLAQLPPWLDAVSRAGSGDDATMCLAARPIDHSRDDTSDNERTA